MDFRSMATWTQGVAEGKKMTQVASGSQGVTRRKEGEMGWRRDGDA